MKVYLFADKENKKKPQLNIPYDYSYIDNSINLPMWWVSLEEMFKYLKSHSWQSLDMFDFYMAELSFSTNQDSLVSIRSVFLKCFSDEEINKYLLLL